jgi:hypothetical protein
MVAGFACRVIPVPQEPPPPELDATSVAVTVAAVSPPPLAVKVVAPVPLELAVIVTVCGVEKLDGVNVSEVGEAVSPVLPLAAMDTVTLEAGADDSASVNVPVLPWVTFRLVGEAVIEPPAVVDATSVAVTVAAVYPLALAVKVVAPVPLELAVTVTVCATSKLDGVNVSEVGEAVSPVLPLEVMDRVTFAVGADDSASVNVPVLPWVTCRLDGVAVTDAAGGGEVDPPAGVQVTEVGAALVPL